MSALKRYLVFKGDTYYPSGGWDDYAGTFDTLEEARQMAARVNFNHDWSHIVDTETGLKIANPET